MAMYVPPPHPSAPGFEILKRFLDAQVKLEGWEVVIRQGTGSELKNLVTSIVSQHGPALIPVTGNPAHCVVILQPDEKGAVICDPSPNQPNHKTMTWAEVEKQWIGGLLHFKRIES